MMYTKICPKCGKKFTTKTDRAKYCSAACRQSAFKEQTRSEARAEKEAAEAAEAKAWKAKAAAQSRKRWKEVEAAAGRGDGLAIMATSKKTSATYWDGYAAYMISYAEQMGKTSTDTVNGISVYSDHFGDEVAASIAELGTITTRS